LEKLHLILNLTPFYSTPILRVLRSYIKLQYQIDDIDRKLLHEISNGVKTKDLPDKIRISLSNVEQRKRNLKKLFELPDLSEDNKLVAEARINSII